MPITLSKKGEMDMPFFHYTVKIEVQQNSYLAHDFERSEKE